MLNVRVKVIKGYQRFRDAPFESKHTELMIDFS
jgi:hypothetical protein